MKSIYEYICEFGDYIAYLDGNKSNLLNKEPYEIKYLLYN